MSYHEYTDSRGRLHRRHNNGHRFNYSAAILPLEKTDDSLAWKTKAADLLQKLVDRDGETAYRAWWERTFESGGETINSYSWRQISEAAQLEWDHPAECGCALPEQVCSICVHTASVAVQEF